MELTDFSHAGSISHKKVIENFWGEHGHKWVWPVW